MPDQRVRCNDGMVTDTARSENSRVATNPYAFANHYIAPIRWHTLHTLTHESVHVVAAGEDSDVVPGKCELTDVNVA